MGTDSDQLRQIIRQLEVLTGLQVVWKAYGGGEVHAADERRYVHANPYCLKVKTDPGRLKRCQEDDNRHCLQQVIANHQPFRRICHAGVCEMVVPILRHQQVEGLLFIGPTRAELNPCPITHLEGLYQELPVEDSEKLCAAAQLLFAAASDQPVQQERHLDSRISKALEIIRNGFQKKLRVRALARQCGLSESRFVHLFRQETGMTFTDYLLDVRIRRARHLLIHTHLLLYQIAELTGFSSAAHLSTTFRQQTGESPSTCRQRSKLPMP